MDKGVQKVYQPADHPDWWYATSKIMEGDGINPLIYVDRNQNKSEGFNIRGTMFANITPFKELAYKCHTDTPYLTDGYYEYGTLGKKTTGKPHSAVIIYKNDGWAAKGGGYKSNHNEYYPIPFSELEVNDVLQQNPYWAKAPTQESY